MLILSHFLLAYHIGLAALTFKRKEQLNSMVELALELPGAFEQGSTAVLSRGVKGALQYLIAARGGIRVSLLGVLVVCFMFFLNAS